MSIGVTIDVVYKEPIADLWYRAEWSDISQSERRIAHKPTTERPGDHSVAR